ncbi:MAG: hypothetical protein Q4B03_02755 [Lachnospiraceae bacterium]|nr:hypothetical protein [Lachnospiraceae bacterium]
MADKELFKTTLMGGYGKDEVEKHIRDMKDEAYVNQNRILQQVKQRDQIIKELNRKLEEKESQLKERDRDIKEKYQSYIDNYDKIGRLVYESRVRADRMILDAREEARTIINEARSLARRRLDQVQAQIDDKLDEGRMKHQAIQKELDELLELLKEVRKRCLDSYENVEFLVDSYTEQEDPFADIMKELEERTGIPEKDPEEELSFQEQIYFMQQRLAEEPEDEAGEEELDEADESFEFEKMSTLRREIEEDEEDILPEIMSVEEVLESIIDRQTASAVPAARSSEETEPEIQSTMLEEADRADETDAEAGAQSPASEPEILNNSLKAATDEEPENSNSEAEPETEVRGMDSEPVDGEQSEKREES